MMSKFNRCQESVIHIYTKKQGGTDRTKTTTKIQVNEIQLKRPEKKAIENSYCMQQLPKPFSFDFRQYLGLYFSRYCNWLRLIAPRRFLL